MAVVNTNISASISQAALAKNERALNKAMEQLSTGRKINSAADDAAGLAISTRMSTQITFQFLSCAPSHRCFHPRPCAFRPRLIEESLDSLRERGFGLLNSTESDSLLPR